MAGWKLDLEMIWNRFDRRGTGFIWKLNHRLLSNKLKRLDLNSFDCDLKKFYQGRIYRAEPIHRRPVHSPGDSATFAEFGEFPARTSARLVNTINRERQTERRSQLLASAAAALRRNPLLTVFS